MMLWLTPVNLGLVEECGGCRGYATVACWCRPAWCNEAGYPEEPSYWCPDCYEAMSHTEECEWQA